MAYLDRIRACNFWDCAGFVPFLSHEQRLGWIRPWFVELLARRPDVFEVRADSVHLASGLGGFHEKTEAVADVLGSLVKKEAVPALHGELYPVAQNRVAPEFLVDREAAAWFGIRAYGQHINGYVRDGDDIRMWIGRRAADKRNFPSKLDHLAAGGLPHGIGLLENVVKECAEEAGIGEELARQARPVGGLTYCRETKKGLKPDTIYCYDLELPADFEPRPTDGEVESFRLVPIDEVIALVRDTDEFKLNCNLVLIDFLIRHGRLGPETENYLDIIQELHPRLP